VDRSQVLLPQREVRKGNPASKLRVSLIVPVYNEEASIGIFLKAIDAVFVDLQDIDPEIVFVNDGSDDGTLHLLVDAHRTRQDVVVVDLSRNFGKEAALSAGIDIATGDALVPMDVDLQDPPELIPRMIETWLSGFEVVLAKRRSRSTDSLAKRLSSGIFYRVHNAIAEPRIPDNVGDFRLMDRVVADALGQLPESRRFMKGLFAWVGFRTTVLEYDRVERAAGSSKFNGWKLWNFAVEGFTGFSTAPLRVWTYLGIAVSILAFVYAAMLMVRTLFFGVDVPGYASTMVAIAIFGGLQLTGIGVIGEYLGRAYIEAKRRPVYLIRRTYRVEPESWT